MNWIRAASVLMALIGALAFGGSQAFARHVACGDTITQDTKLDSDLIDCPGDGIVIGAGGTTLDLHGHAVDGTQSGPVPFSSGISNADGYDGVNILDGIVRDFGSDVRLEGASDNLVRGLSASNSISGIDVIGSDGVRVLTNELSANVTHPILLLNTEDSLVEDNRVSNTVEGEGIVLSDARENRISSNSIEGGITGVLVDLSRDNLVDRNRVRGATAFGGIVLLDANSGNRVVRNRVAASVNGIDLEEAADDNVISRNHVTRNALDGIRVAGGSGSTGNVITLNTTRRNGDDGIGVEAAGNTLARNLAVHNDDLGIEAITGTIDGGGNRAFGNGNPLQCLNIECK